MASSVAVLLTRVKRGLQELQSEPYEWLILVGNRLVLAGLLTVAFALSVTALMAGDVVVVRNTTRMLYLFQVLTGGNLTLVTIVLSINQLVLSREFKAPGELNDHIQDVINYRNRVQETTRKQSVPADPSDFLAVILDGTRGSAQRLGGAVRNSDHDRFVDEFDALVADVTAHSDEIRDVLDHSHGGIFHALAVTLNTNYSYQLNEARRLQTVHEDDLQPATREMLDELIQSLKQVDIARQYFKSIYIQSELAHFSRILLYVGVPAIGSALLMLLIYAGTSEPAVAGVPLELLVAAVVVLGFSPLAVLFSFILRSATVAQRTVAITPFTMPAEETKLGER